MLDVESVAACGFAGTSFWMEEEEVRRYWLFVIGEEGGISD
jgi:hypothetical protein